MHADGCFDGNRRTRAEADEQRSVPSLRIYPYETPNICAISLIFSG